MKIQQVNNIQILKKLKNSKHIADTKLAIKHIPRNIETTDITENMTKSAFPIVISEEQLKNYSKQILEEIANWKKIFG